MEHLNTNKTGIRHLAQICAEKGMKHVVLSPGSRCAPLIIAFAQQPEIECYSIVDERSAAFFGMGIAQQTGEPVGIICTSGSAVLNYGPAIAEAFYQKIPLIVITADRPNEWIDQGENQSINQYRIYNNYIKRSFELPVSTENEKDLWYNNRIVSEALNTAIEPHKGPVHLNVPLREPLYELEVPNPDALKPKVIETPSVNRDLRAAEWQTLLTKWGESERILIICGAETPSDQLKSMLVTLKQNQEVVILSEATGNLALAADIDRIDPCVEVIVQHKLSGFVPDLLISFGGPVVSKKLKFWLRSNHPQEHWHLSDSRHHWDTFQSLSRVLNVSAERFFEVISGSTKKVSDTYSNRWKNLNDQVNRIGKRFIDQLVWSDFHVFVQLHRLLTTVRFIQMGNSTPIRYANLLSWKNSNIQFNANRGISGIDGQVSTAAGASLMREDLTLLVTGDLAFFYDSNGLWNDHLDDRLKVIVINNGGGNIFRIIPGPDRVENFEQFIEKKHELNCRPIADLYKLPYYFCDSIDQFASTLNNFLSDSSGKPAILEVQTPAETSGELLRDYFAFLVTNYTG